MVRYTIGNSIFRGILYNEKDNYEIQVSRENKNIERLPNLVDDDESTYSCTTSSLYSFFMFEFKNNLKVEVNKYAVRSHNDDGNNPRQWALSGYNGKKWVNLSIVVESGLITNGASKTYDIDHKEPVSKIKMTLIGNTYLNVTYNLQFCMADFDIFGIITHNFRGYSCKKASISFNNILIYVFIMSC